MKFSLPHPQPRDSLVGQTLLAPLLPSAKQLVHLPQGVFLLLSTAVRSELQGLAQGLLAAILAVLRGFKVSSGTAS